MSSLDEIEERLNQVRSDIADFVQKPEDVRIVAVTKKFEVDQIQVLSDLGLRDFGENYAQELSAKAGSFTDVNWHFVGGLQRNKVKKIADIVSVWHSVSTSKLLSEIANRCTNPEVFIQVNLTGEPQKSGCSPDEIKSLVDQGITEGVNVVGLMVMGPAGGGDPEPVFERAKELTDEFGFGRLSMGMSGDYKVALRHGATDLRLGEALLGKRQQ